MAKTNEDKKSISEVIPQLKACGAKLRLAEERNLALVKELSACKKVAASDRPLLASGLRLAQANAVLEGKIEALQKEAVEGSNNKSRKGSPGRSSVS